jgi:malate dehydrogenase (oxaloacetate-decarboxylating)(NADP+)
MVYKTFAKECLEYHEAQSEFDTNGKTGTLVTKGCATQEELSMAYSPGVAYPCQEIKKDQAKAYDYTNKGNLVAVISNGSAVLGLGDIGPLASKPVMEGKAVLFKKFANIDAVDIEIDSNKIEDIIDIVSKISVSFGGINLEDIKAPECFAIEEKLKEICSDVPVFHDDQHGTAVITTAALINVLKMTGKRAEEVKVIIIGAGAAGIASGNMYRNLGVKNIIMFDSKGAIHQDRTDLNIYKASFATGQDISLEEAIKGSDMVLGLSKGNIITKKMVESMADTPIIFACANPTPEIMPEEALSVRTDLIIGTGRSDYPNQVNNVLGFPHIFRGALDVRATHITENMKLAAANALAELAREDVPNEVRTIHNRDDMEFGRAYVIPSPFDKRVFIYVSSAVAQAAVDDNVAQIDSFYKKRYIEHLKDLVTKF